MSLKHVLATAPTEKMSKYVSGILGTPDSFLVLEYRALFTGCKCTSPNRHKASGKLLGTFCIALWEKGWSSAIPVPIPTLLPGEGAEDGVRIPQNAVGIP